MNTIAMYMDGMQRYRRESSSDNDDHPFLQQHLLLHKGGFDWYISKRTSYVSANINICRTLSFSWIRPYPSIALFRVP